MRKLTTIAAMVLLCAGPLAAQDDPAGLIIRVQGGVTVTHGGAQATSAAVGERVFVGDQVTPDPGSRAILITRSGAQQVITAATTIEEPRGAGNPDLFARAITTLAQAASTDATTGGRQGMIRPIPGTSSLVGPRNELAVSSGRPTFRWTSTPGQTYDLMLRRVDGGRPQIYEVGTDTVWTLPEEAPELEAGAEYAWTVFVGGRRGGRPLPQQEFRVISLVESVEMQDYLDEIGVFGLDPAGDGLFLTVVAYRDMELFYDARDALEAVEAQGGALSPDMYMLLGEILAELGHESEARAAFDRADEAMR
jgi:hypothetical protein